LVFPPVPSVVTAASGRLFRKGLLIKHGTVLEGLAEVDTVVFDKTGTLTMGTPVATNLATHPPAQALNTAAQGEGRRPEMVAGLREVPGYGVKSTWKGRQVRLGRAEWCGGAAPRAFTFAGCPRPGAAVAVRALQAAGLRVILLSGDTAGAVAATAAHLGIADWAAGQLPAEKAARVMSLTAAGHRVLMVGDELNDTGALAVAHVSISPASALEAARVASDIILLGQDMTPIADALRISRQATRRRWQCHCRRSLFR
jgi:P-type Cu2+ transporter